MRKAPARLFVYFALLLLINCNEHYEAELAESQPVFIRSDLEHFQADENGESFTTTDPDLFLGGADGRSTDFARSGQFSMRLDSNRKYGLCKKYFPNGNLMSEIYFRNGRANGGFKTYYENGNLEEEGVWKGRVYTGGFKPFSFANNNI